MRYKELLESVRHQTLYHWTDVAKATTALKTNKLQARRWQHYIEPEDRMVKGSSWCANPSQWQKDNPVCFVIDGRKLPNKVHDINGNRVYWQTQGMMKPDLYDPKAYLDFDTTPDEQFVEGTVTNLKDLMIQVKTNDPSFAKLAKDLGFEVVKI